MPDRRDAITKALMTYRPGVYADPLRRDMQRQGAVMQAAQQQAGGMIEPGNIDLSAHPVVRNPDGSISVYAKELHEQQAEEYRGR